MKNIKKEGLTKYKFDSLFSRITTKNENNNKNILTISAQYGLINQEVYFNKVVASKDLSGYYYLEKGDFAYNKSYSKDYPMGAVKRLSKYDSGIVSPLYICFRLKREDVCPEYMEQYFESGILNKELYRIAQEGARNHGLLNISVTEFFKDINIYLPSFKTQQKVSNILAKCDLVIEKQQEILEEKKKYYQGLIQRLLSGEVRFNKDNGQSFPEWQKVKLGEYLIKHNEKSEFNNQYPVLTSSRKGIFLQSDYYAGNDVASDDTTGYNVVPRGYFTYRHMSDDLVFKFNINDIVDKGIVSTLYPVFTVKGIDSYFLKVKLNEGDEFKKFALAQKQGGSRTYMYFSKLESLQMNIPSLEEQEKISEVLKLADKEIELLEKELEALKLQKKGLMQRLLTGEVRVKV